MKLMRKGKAKFSFKEKGITLIALVISIIVLLILAGVTIATLTGENGILTRANDAKEQTKQAEEEELRRLTILEAATHLENYEYTDKNNKKVVIPAGFAVSQIEGENTIDDGLVVIDKNGNEFTWVPVNNENYNTQFQRRSGYYDNNPQTLTSNYGEANATGNNTNTEVSESMTTQKEAKEMYKSVYDNEGFYIGRYEVGKDKNNSEKIVIQKAAEIYNNVTWSKNKTMNEESLVDGTEKKPDGAIELARNFDTQNGYTTVTSTLCYGVQWDATLTWIDPDYMGYAKNSTGMGWYNEYYQDGKIWKTGIDLNGGKNKIKNIYDLAGNLYEWTMESGNTSHRVIRGGNFYNSGSHDPASCRTECAPSESNFSFGFRVALYLNIEGVL